MSEEAPGIVTIGDARDIQRLWELGHHDPNYIAEARRNPLKSGQCFLLREAMHKNPFWQ